MKEKGFDIPEGYFKGKKADLKKISENAELVQKPVANFKRWYFAAAAIILAALFIPKLQQENSSLNFSDLQSEELLDYLISDPDAINPESFIEFNIDTLIGFEFDDEDLIESYLDQHSTEFL
jgi:hypothetical protein